MCVTLADAGLLSPKSVVLLGKWRELFTRLWGLNTGLFKVAVQTTLWVTTHGIQHEHRRKENYNLYEYK